MRFSVDKMAWAFAQTKDIDLAKLPVFKFNLKDLYKQSLNTREAKKELYQRALNSALENLASWERMARADGFSVTTVTDTHNGAPYPVFSNDGQHVTFTQAYGVIVQDEEE